MVEWFPSKDFKDFAYILDVMHKTSQRIYAEKKASMGHPASEQDVRNAQRSEGDIAPLMKGKDIMSILRMQGSHRVRSRCASDEPPAVKANASSNEADRMTDSELIGQMRYDWRVKASTGADALQYSSVCGLRNHNIRYLAHSLGAS